MLLQELLVGALQLGVEHDAADDGAVLAEALGLPFVRLVDLGVVEQLARALEAGVELLLAPVAVAFEDVATSLREHHQSTAIANGDGPDQVLLLQMSEVAAAWVEWLALAVAQVFGVGDTERTDGRQRAHLGAPQQDALLADPHALPIGASGQVEVAREDVARIPGLAFERVGSAASAALVQLTAGFRPTRIVSFIRPTGIEVHELSSLM